MPIYGFLTSNAQSLYASEFTGLEVIWFDYRYLGHTYVERCQTPFLYKGLAHETSVRPNAIHGLGSISSLRMSGRPTYLNMVFVPFYAILLVEFHACHCYYWSYYTVLVSQIGHMWVIIVFVSCNNNLLTFMWVGIIDMWSGLLMLTCQFMCGYSIYMYM